MGRATIRIESVREQLHAKLAPLAHALNTPDGALLLAELENRFVFGELLGETPEQTAYNLGARDVVMYLRELRALTAKQGG